jgi:hypothetical protein
MGVVLCREIDPGGEAIVQATGSTAPAIKPVLEDFVARYKT